MVDVFCIKDLGEVYVDKVEVCSDGKMAVIDDYEELKAWWQKS